MGELEPYWHVWFAPVLQPHALVIHSRRITRFFLLLFHCRTDAVGHANIAIAIVDSGDDACFLPHRLGLNLWASGANAAATWI